MGRNRKVGLDWWPRDIGLYRDPKLRAARQKFGVLGPYVYECLLDIAYGDKGYYIAYSGEGREDTLWQLREYIAGLENVTIETLAAVVDQLVASGLFHAALYERGFLTSKRIQMGYFLATVTRNAVPINFDIWLLTEQEMREISSRSVLLQKFVSREENPGFTNEKPQFPSDESTHSKVKEKDRNIDSNSTLLHSDVEEILGERLNKANRSAIAKMRSLGMTDEVITATAHYAVGHAKSDSRGYVPYFMTVLRERLKNGVLTAANLSRPKEQSRPKQENSSGYLSPTNIGGTERQQDDSQLSDWEREWKKRVMNRSKENSNDD